MKNGQIDWAMNQEAKNMKKINETQRKIIHLLNDLGIDRISKREKKQQQNKR